MKEESKNRQSQENDAESFSAAKRPPSQSDGDGNEDILMASSSMDEADDDTVGIGDELTNLLDSTESNRVGELPKVKFIDNPYSSTLIFQTSSLHITINGNEESCGSSFSGSESSVMVSVDRGGMANIEGVEWRLNGGAWGSTEAEEGGTGTGTGTGGGFLKGRVMVGWDGSDFDDYMLARFLGEDVAF